MNTPIPKMTKIQEHFEDSNLELDLSKDADGNYLDEVARYAWMNWVTAYSFGREHRANILNKAIEIALAEQQESEYITAEQARELVKAGGTAEWCSDDFKIWYKCKIGDKWFDNFNDGRTCLYRAIKAQPEPAQWPSPNAKREPVDPHEDLRAEYIRQRDAVPCELGFYLWEVLEGDTVEWWTASGYHDNKGFSFNEKGTYTYAPKATIKLDGKMVTPEQAAAEWAAKKETCDVWYKSDTDDRFDKQDGIILWNKHKDVYNCEYELRPKAIKVVKGSDIPVGVAVNCFQLEGLFVLQWVNGESCQITQEGQAFYPATSALILASEQPWLPYIQGETDLSSLEGLKIELMVICGRGNLTGFALELRGYTNDPILLKRAVHYKITGIAKGYELK